MHRSHKQVPFYSNPLNKSTNTHLFPLFVYFYPSMDVFPLRVIFLNPFFEYRILTSYRNLKIGFYQFEFRTFVISKWLPLENVLLIDSKEQIKCFSVTILLQVNKYQYLNLTVGKLLVRRGS